MFGRLITGDGMKSEVFIFVHVYACIVPPAVRPCFLGHRKSSLGMISGGSKAQEEPCNGRLGDINRQGEPGGQDAATACSVHKLSSKIDHIIIAHLAYQKYPTLPSTLRGSSLSVSQETDL